MMMSVLRIPFALLSLLFLTGCETSLAPQGGQPAPEASEPSATLITNPILESTVRESVPGSPQQRIPESVLESEAESDSPVLQSIDLSGRWLLTLPAGFQYRVEFDLIEEHRYQLRNAATFSGVYQLNGDVLQIVEPGDERLNIFDWQLHNSNTMTLVDETGASGARYAGATMGRQIEWEDADLPRKILAIGRPAVPRAETTTRPAARIARQATLTGLAFNDETRGPYLETDETIIFINRHRSVDG